MFCRGIWQEKSYTQISVKYDVSLISTIRQNYRGPCLQRQQQNIRNLFSSLSRKLKVSVDAHNVFCFSLPLPHSKAISISYYWALPVLLQVYNPIERVQELISYSHTEERQYTLSPRNDLESVHLSCYRRGPLLRPVIIQRTKPGENSIIK